MSVASNDIGLESGAPSPPGSLEEAGLCAPVVEQLILKILYLHGELYGQALSAAIGLPFSVILGLVEDLRARRYVEVKRSLGLGDVSAVLALTETGRNRTRDCLESNQYCGPAPVPMAQYTAIVRRQRLKEGWLTQEALAGAFAGLVLSGSIRSQMGPAVSSASSFLLYGKPGDGKTSLMESLANLDADPVYIPYAVECQGNIVQIYDPVHHQRIEERCSERVAAQPAHDGRWLKCRRPFVVTGGELTLDMLDLQYNLTSKVYEAPFQLKANNGIYLIDDFGRQRVTPAEVLNRWIVPMERGVDYLSFQTGGKMKAPFEAFLVFSTNLAPADLGDEALLRRIRYKMQLPGPTHDELMQIFEQFCTAHGIGCAPGLAARFIAKHYRRAGMEARRCHPRDVLSHALDLMRFERLPVELTDGILDRAFESCFVQQFDGGTRELEAEWPASGPPVPSAWNAISAAEGRHSDIQNPLGMPSGPV